MDIALAAGGFRLRLSAAGWQTVDRVVLCLGNFPPAAPCADMPGGLAPPRYIADPWDTAALAAIPSTTPVLIVGTGLTMADVVVSLLDQDHRGSIDALSRRGLRPQEHAAVAHAHALVGPAEAVPRLLALLRRMRAAARRDDIGGGWRAVIDGLRPHTQRLWREWSEAERRRFLRHLRPYWEVHRHWLAPAVAQQLQGALDKGRLRLLAGRLQRIRVVGMGLRADYRPRHGERDLTLGTHTVINCTGPQCDFTRIVHPLLRSLLERGLARPDALGLAATGSGQLLDAAHHLVPGLYALGPLVRGTVWELIAVPELRHAAAGLGVHLVAVASGRGSD